MAGCWRWRRRGRVWCVRRPDVVSLWRRGAVRCGEQDPLLDRFMPSYDVAERHHVRVAAPSAVTLAAAREVKLQGSPLWPGHHQGTRGDPRRHSWTIGRVRRGLFAEAQSLGWGVLAEVPDREVVVGAVTRPWRRMSPSAAAGPVRGLQRAWLRQDRVDAPCGVDRRDRFNLPDGNACGRHGPDGAGQVPLVLGVSFSRHHPDSGGRFSSL